jgi:4'-phosphopantetheinyl transferase
LDCFSDFTSTAERERAQKFHFAADRWSYLSAQALLRWSLSNQLGSEPLAIHYRRTAEGQPLLEDDSRGLYFSLTHARGLVAVALSKERSLGVDVEQVKQDTNAEELARSYFSSVELAHLLTLNERDRLKHFLIQWTLKEAFLKAIGMGLHAPLDSLQVIPRNERIEYVFRPPLYERAEGWRFWAGVLRAHHLAVAVRSDLPEITIRLGWGPRFWEHSSAL